MKIGKKSRLYLMPYRLAIKKFRCKSCNKLLVHNDITLSKPTQQHKTKHYCGKCALRLNMITKEEYENVLEGPKI